MIRAEHRVYPYLLGESACAGLAVVEHPGRGLLRRGARWEDPGLGLPRPSNGDRKIYPRRFWRHE